MTFLPLLLLCSAAIAGPAERSRLAPVAELFREHPDLRAAMSDRIRAVADGSTFEQPFEDALGFETAKALVSARERVLAEPEAEAVLGLRTVQLLRALPAVEPSRLAPGPVAPELAARLSAVREGLDLSEAGLARVFAEDAGTAVAASPDASAPAGLARSIAPPGASAALREVLGHFQELSKIFRPSKGEREAREHVLKLARARGLETFVDAAGNLLVRVPGTGRFAGSKNATALQAHLDMVLDVNPDLLEGGKKTEEFFKRGIELVAEDGWIHSKGYATTIGADNGLSVAIMKRYITARGLEHPPLELIFTVDEEAGMTGAAGLDVPLTAKSIVNLDGEDWGIAWIGGMGAKSALVTHTAPRAKVPAGFAKREVRLSGLLGGHSGIEIHLGRANAVRIFAETLQRIERALPEALVLRASAGTQGVYNKIPSVLDFALAVPADKVEALNALVAEIAADLAARFAPVEKSEEIKMTVKASSRGPRSGLGMADAARWAALLLAVPDGVVAKDEALPNQVEASSNIGFMSVSPKAGKTALQFGIMPRAYAEDKLDAVTDRALALAAEGPFKTRVSATDRSPPWNPDPKSGLLAAFLQVAERWGGFRVEIVPAGLETGYFAIKFPGKEMISVGPTIRDAHSFRERLEIASLDRFIELLDEFLKTREP